MRRPSNDESPNYVFLQCLKIFALSAVVTTALQVILADEAQAQTAQTTTKAKKGKAPAAAQLPPANQAQMDAFARAHQGDYACEMGQTLAVTPHTTPGYLQVKFAKHQFTMKPVVSSTGAVRLEDVTGRALMVQIANKSMLLDNKIGQRLVDECVHPSQRSAADAAKTTAAS